MKTAIVHDYLVNMGGAEKVLEQILKLFPDATIFTSIHRKGSVSAEIESFPIKTSFLQYFPAAKTNWQYYLPLMPKAFESFNLDSYDMVVSSSHACAKGVIVKPTARHICYCHTPMRYAWNLGGDYLQRVPRIARPLFRSTMTRLRKWDAENSNRVDHFIANSKAVAERIMRYYGKDADVIFPPVDTGFFTVPKEAILKREYYLTVSRFTPYKRVDLAVDACAASGRKLKVVGSTVGKGTAFNKKKTASNIEFLGTVRGEQLRDLYRNAKAFIMPAVEDFGITTVEAQACGTPVIAFKGGGSLDTVVEGRTGIFFSEQTPVSLIQAMDRVEKMDFSEVDIRLHAEAFSNAVFLDKMRLAISLYLSESAVLPFRRGENR